MEHQPPSEHHHYSGVRQHMPYGSNNNNGAGGDYYQQLPPPSYEFTQALQLCMASMYALGQEIVFSHLVECCAWMRFVVKRADQLRIDYVKWVDLYERMSLEFQTATQAHVSALQNGRGIQMSRILQTLSMLRNFCDVYRAMHGIQVTLSVESTNALIEYFVFRTEMLADVFSESNMRMQVVSSAASSSSNKQQQQQQ